MATILIGGDICPIGRNTEHFQRGDADALFHDLLDDFAHADLVIANLECPLIERPSPIAKTGPVFGEATACIRGIAAGGIDVLNLANNHILDHGREGLESTLAACAGAGVATVGAGLDLAAAREILVKDASGIRVGLLAMAEHEFSVATEASAGANPLDVIDFVRNLMSHRGCFDYLVVLLHAGHEFLTAPSPRLRNTCHFLVEMGADAVIVQHPHAFGGYERYRDRYIVYGQGALLMDEELYRGLETFHESVLIALTVHPGEPAVMRLVPLMQSLEAAGARRMVGERAAATLREIDEKSLGVQDHAYIHREWLKFCDQRKHGYMSALMGHGRLLRRLNRNGLLSRLLYRRQQLLATRNVVCCESHREAVETILTGGLV